MIRWIRTARIASSAKYGKAMDFAQKSKLLSARFPDAKKIDVFLDVAGNTATMRWMIDYPDLATFEKVFKQVLADTDYWKLLGEYDDAFVQGDVQDVILTQI
jgi:hypothetical protein